MKPATTSQTELGLLNVARASLDELTSLTGPQRCALYAPWLDHSDPATRANALICLIHQANFLLDRQLATAARPRKARSPNHPPVPNAALSWPSAPNPRPISNSYASH